MEFGKPDRWFCAQEDTNSIACVTSSSGWALRAARHIATGPSVEAMTNPAKPPCACGRPALAPLRT